LQQRSETRRKRKRDSHLEYFFSPSLTKFYRQRNDLASGEEEEEEDEGYGSPQFSTHWKEGQEDNNFRPRPRKKPRLSIDDVIQASNLYELCEKKGIVQENLSANDYFQYVKTRKMLEKQNEIPLNVGFKRDAPFEYSPFFDWQCSLKKDDIQTTFG
jgi:hypothetical protein